MSAAIHLWSPDGAASDSGTEPTTADLIDHWRSTESRYSTRAYAERDRQLSLFADRFGSTAPADLTGAEVVGWINSQPGWKAAATRKVAFQSINHVFNLAVRHRLIDRNPLSGLGQDFEDGDPRRPVTRDEFQAMLRGTDKEFQRLLIFMWLSGVRPGEAEALRWADVQFEKRCLVIEKHKTRKHTRKPRVVPLTAPARRLLAWMHARATGQVVFPNRTGTAFNSQSVGNRLSVFRERGVIQDGCTLHGIRHAWATRMIGAGVPVKIVSQVLGHRTTEITERVYCHIGGEVDLMIEALEGRRVDHPGGV